jgi:hypothetical protein
MPIIFNGKTGALGYRPYAQSQHVATPYFEWRGRIAPC